MLRLVCNTGRPVVCAVHCLLSAIDSSVVVMRSFVRSFVRCLIDSGDGACPMLSCYVEYLSVTVVFRDRSSSPCMCCVVHVCAHDTRTRVGLGGDMTRGAIILTQHDVITTVSSSSSSISSRRRIHQLCGVVTQRDADAAYVTSERQRGRR